MVAIGSFFMPYGYLGTHPGDSHCLALGAALHYGGRRCRGVAGSVEAQVLTSIAWFSFLAGAMLLALTLRRRLARQCSDHSRP